MEIALIALVALVLQVYVIRSLLKANKELALIIKSPSTTEYIRLESEQQRQVYKGEDDEEGRYKPLADMSQEEFKDVKIVHVEN